MSLLSKAPCFCEKPTKLPEWINLDANESTSMAFFIFPEHRYLAYKAIKDSILPRKVIDYLMVDGTLDTVLSRAGFGAEYTSEDCKRLQGFIFKEVLGEYNEEFLNTIAPYVSPFSYIEIKDNNNSKYRWVFNGSTCKKAFVE